jgi:glycosyltransferase involved in cell wall biosynthesis
MCVPVTVIIHTLNEERNIRNCLESVKWAEEIVLIDMYSDDKTVEIARQYTDKIYYHERVNYVEPARAFGLTKASNEWVLVVDADEMVPKKLKDCLQEIATNIECDGVLIPHGNYFFGKKMIATGWGTMQDMHIRFFKKQYMIYSDQIHSFSHLKEGTKIYPIKDETCSFIHFNYLDPEHFLEKMNRYTTIEVQNLKDKRKSISTYQLVKRVLDIVYDRYIRKKGYKDGFQGLALSLLMGTYVLSMELKLLISEKYSCRDEIVNEYNKIAEGIIKEYQKFD